MNIVIDNAGPQVQSFAYDSLDRLTSADAVGGLNGLYAETYTYDPLTDNLASKAGNTYTYGDTSHAHAVTSLSNGNTYVYDANGNQVSRIIGTDTFSLTYDAENRLTTVLKNGQPLTGFTYDGDGVQVAATLNGVTTKYVGGIYEVEGTNITKYYLAGMNHVAMRSNGVLNYLLQDHLGSTALVIDTMGGVVSEQRYKAWGETRYSSSTANTDYLYTGQREVADIGLYFYKARWYDSTLGRFSQADSIVPGEESNFTPLIVDFGEYVNLNQVNLENLALQKENGIPASKFPKNSISLDRYCYSFNNPNYYIDPSGHNPIIVVVIGGMVIGIGATEICLLGIAGALILHNALPGREERIVALATALEDLSQQAASAIQSLFSHKADVAYGDYLADKYGLSKQQRRELHDNITRQGLTKKEIEKEAAELARLKKQNENNQNENDDNE